jgi:hypothetical protein
VRRSAGALTGDLLEASTVRNDNAPTLFGDQALRLEHAKHGADRRALNAEQLGQIGMGHGQEVVINPVARAQEPVAAAGLHYVDHIAGYGPKGLA